MFRYFTARKKKYEYKAKRKYQPSNIGKLNDLSEHFGWEEYIGARKFFVIDENGKSLRLSAPNISVYYCWWD